MALYFSIILPYLNVDAAELERALTSISGQVREGQVHQGQIHEGLALEIIAVDDGSDNDHLPSADRLFDACTVPVTRIRHDKNRGLAAARNSGIAAARGEYIVFLDADDWLLPGALNRLKAHLDRHPNDLTYTLTRLVAQAGQSGKRARGDDAINADFAHSGFAHSGNEAERPEELASLSLAMSAWAHVYRRGFFERTNIRFDPVQKRWEDRPFIVAAQLAAGEVGFCPVELHAYFVGRKPGSITQRRYDRRDVLFMSRHIRNVDKTIARNPALEGSAYAGQHYWQGLARFYTVIGSALFPIMFSDHHARKLALGTAMSIYLRGCQLARKPGGLAPPHPVLALARMPGFVRSYLAGSLNVGHNPIKLVNLWGLLGAVAFLRWMASKRP